MQVFPLQLAPVPRSALSSMCSDVNKPNGVTVIAPTFSDSKSFIQSMPTRRVPGIGRVLEKILRDALGCSSMADVYSRRAEIHALFTPASSSFLIKRSVGHGDALHALPALPGTAGGRKSYSQERALWLVLCVCPLHAVVAHIRWNAGTIGDCSDEKVLASLVERLCRSLAEDLAADCVSAKQIVVKVKRSDFTVKQHSFVLPSPASCADDLAPVALRLLHMEMPAAVRLVGVKVTQLSAAGSGGGGVNAISGMLHRAMQAADAAAVTMCPICLKVITGEPPNVGALALVLSVAAPLACGVMRWHVM